MIIFLAGPIDYWWNENWQTLEHQAYARWRKELNDLLVSAGHLVYRPHEAFKGAWQERAQDVNIAAIDIADVVFDLRPAGVPAYGTEREIEFANALGRKVLTAPPGDYTNIADYLKPLDDPYGDVHRKSYTRRGK